ncbi:MAG: hypothetical protein ABI581_06885 [Sediminibacterium sp.]
MDKYRRPDQEYYDDYDRRTLASLKEMEILEAQRLHAIPNEDERHVQYVADTLTGQSFNDAAVIAYRLRTERVEELMKKDEERDRMIKMAPRPPASRCTTCMQTMIDAGHVLKEESKQVIFLFDCPDGHASRRAFYSDGREHIVQNTCAKCGSNKITTKKKDTKKKLTITDTCRNCGDVSVLEFDRTPKPPIDETERSRYLFQYAGKKTQQEQLRTFLTFLEEVKMENQADAAKELLELDKIEKPTIHKLQQRIIEEGAKNGFVAFQLDKPEIVKDVLTVGFTMQDAKDRKEKESLETFNKFLQTLLLPTNWRIFKKSSEYRLGFLSAKLQGFESEADLMKIAAEIIESKKK